MDLLQRKRRDGSVEENATTEVAETTTTDLVLVVDVLEIQRSLTGQIW